MALPVGAVCHCSLFISFRFHQMREQLVHEDLFSFSAPPSSTDFIPLQKSSTKGVPILSLDGELNLDPRLDPYQNEAVVQMWMEVKLKPLLRSITKHFLSCLSTKNFSCSTYQTMYVQARPHEAPVDAYCPLSHPCLLLQGARAEPSFF